VLGRFETDHAFMKERREDLHNMPPPFLKEGWGGFEKSSDSLKANLYNNK
jgi:hypothetical protein